MTPAERATTYAYALVNQAKDHLETAYRVLSLDTADGAFLKSLPEIRKAFFVISEPMDNLVSALSKEVSRLTEWNKEEIGKKEK